MTLTTTTPTPLLAGALLGAITLASPPPASAQTAEPIEAPEAEPTRIEIRQTYVREPTLVREGAFLYDMRGELRRTELGWVMDFAPDTRTGQRLGSMILQHGMTLTAMEQIIAAHDEPIGFVVSGQVFVYHQRNYLLPTRFAIAAQIERPDTPQDTDAEPAPTRLPGFDDAPDEPSVEGLLKDIKTNPAQRRAMPMAPAVSTAAKLREGEMIAQVRGRVLPGPGGELVFTQNSDSNDDPETIQAELPPMQLMPCLNVERLEKLRHEWGDRLVVSMSGRVFVDAGSPILLPTMYVIELDRAGNLTLGQ